MRRGGRAFPGRSQHVQIPEGRKERVGEGDTGAQRVTGSALAGDSGDVDRATFQRLVNVASESGALFYV